MSGTRSASPPSMSISTKVGRMRANSARTSRVGTSRPGAPGVWRRRGRGEEVRRDEERRAAGASCQHGVVDFGGDAVQAHGAAGFVGMSARVGFVGVDPFRAQPQGTDRREVAEPRADLEHDVVGREGDRGAAAFAAFVALRVEEPAQRRAGLRVELEGDAPEADPGRVAARAAKDSAGISRRR